MEKLKLGTLGERLKTSGASMGRMVSGKMKDLLQAQTTESKMVEEATSDNLQEPNWGMNLRICGMLNSDEFSGQEVLKAIKKKICGKNVTSQRLSLDLLETCAMNCEKVFSEIASEKVLDEMVKMIDDSKTIHGNRLRALQLIRAWGESEDLGYLPVFRQTHNSLKARGAAVAVQDENSAFLGSNFGERSLLPPENYPISDTDLHNIDDETIIFNSGSLSLEEKKEFLVTTRNSVELLSSILGAAEPMPIEMNTATIIDDAITYITGLQNHVKGLSERLIEMETVEGEKQGSEEDTTEEIEKFQIEDGNDDSTAVVLSESISEAPVRMTRSRRGTDLVDLSPSPVARKKTKGGRKLISRS